MRVSLRTWEVCGDGRYAHDSAFGWCVAPGLVVAGEHPQVTPSDKLLVVKSKQRVCRWQELRVKHHLQQPMVNSTH